MLRYWSGKCAVTGLAIEPLLRASNIKPWRDSNNREQLDVFNGLLLGAAYDAAFDVGLIAFQADGRIIISGTLSEGQRKGAGLDAAAALRSVSEQHQEYLAYHRSTVFGKAQGVES